MSSKTASVTTKWLNSTPVGSSLVRPTAGLGEIERVVAVVLFVHDSWIELGECDARFDGARWIPCDPQALTLLEEQVRQVGCEVGTPLLVRRSDLDRLPEWPLISETD